MPRFRYTAYSSDGVREDGALDVPTEAQAWDKLTSLGLTVVELLAEIQDPAAARAGRAWRSASVSPSPPRQILPTSWRCCLQPGFRQCRW